MVKNYINLILLLFLFLSLNVIAVDLITNKQVLFIKPTKDEYTYKTIPIYENKTICNTIKNNQSIIKGKDEFIEVCNTEEIVKEYKTIESKIQITDKTESKLVYGSDVLEYGQKQINCKHYSDYIICDDEKGKDGNGDGICQAGETCHTYKLEKNQIILQNIKNGDVILKN